MVTARNTHSVTCRDARSRAILGPPRSTRRSCGARRAPGARAGAFRCSQTDPFRSADGPLRDRCRSFLRTHFQSPKLKIKSEFE